MAANFSFESTGKYIQTRGESKAGIAGGASWNGKVGLVVPTSRRAFQVRRRDRDIAPYLSLTVGRVYPSAPFVKFRPNGPYSLFNPVKIP